MLTDHPRTDMTTRHHGRRETEGDHAPEKEVAMNLKAQDKDCSQVPVQTSEGPDLSPEAPEHQDPEGYQRSDPRHPTKPQVKQQAVEVA